MRNRERAGYEWGPIRNPPPRYPPPPFENIPQSQRQDFDTNSSISPMRSASEPGPQHLQNYFSQNRGQPAADMNGAPVQNYSHLYNNNWDYQTSPPPRAESDYGLPGGCIQSPHDSTRSQSDDDRRVKPRFLAPDRLEEPRPGIREWERRRVTKYRRDSSSSRDSCPSDRTVHPGQRRNHYDQQRSRQRRARSQHGRAGGPHQQQQQVQPAQQQVQKNSGLSLENIVTPLRLGIMFGCFDIIGGSLSVWMTRKRFGKAAQMPLQLAAAGGADGGRDRRRSRHRKHAEYCSETEDSEDEERRSRTGEHFREQLRLDYDHGRSGRCGRR